MYNGVPIRRDPDDEREEIFQAKAAEIGLPVFYDDGPAFSDKIKVIEQEIQNFKDVLLADN